MLTIALAAGSGYLAALLARHDRLATPAYDLGFFQQLVWNLGHGHGLVSSFESGNFLGLHFSPLLAIPAALELAWPDARLLTTLHIVALASLGPATFLLTRAVVGHRRGRLIVATALSAPVPVWIITQEAVRADFHPEALSLPLALLAGWAGLSGRRAAMWTLACVALLGKEDQAGAVGVVGLLVAARAHDVAARRDGRRLALMALGYSAVVVLIVMPAIRATTSGSTPFDTYYGWVVAALGAGGPGALALAAAAMLSRPEGWIMTGRIVLSGGGLALLRPRWLLAIGPPVALHLLSAHQPQPALRLQYGLTLLVPAVVASALGARRLLAIGARLHRRLRAERWRGPGQRLPALGRVSLLAVAVPALLLGTTWSSASPLVRAPGDASRGGLARLDRALAVVPPEVPLATEEGLAAPLADRSVLVLIGRPIPDDAYVVADRASAPGVTEAALRQREIEHVSHLRSLLYDDGRIRVWGPAR